MTKLRCYRSWQNSVVTGHDKSQLVQVMTKLSCYRSWQNSVVTGHDKTQLLQVMKKLSCYRSWQNLDVTGHDKTQLLQVMTKLRCYRSWQNSDVTGHDKSQFLQVMTKLSCYRSRQNSDLVNTACWRSLSQQCSLYFLHFRTWLSGLKSFHCFLIGTSSQTFWAQHTVELVSGGGGGGGPWAGWTGAEMVRSSAVDACHIKGRSRTRKWLFYVKPKASQPRSLIISCLNQLVLGKGSYPN